jgi:hypothetical protein
MKIKTHTIREMLYKEFDITVKDEVFNFIPADREFIYFDDLIKYLEEKQAYLDNIYLIIRDLKKLK